MAENRVALNLSEGVFSRMKYLLEKTDTDGDTLRLHTYKDELIVSVHGNTIESVRLKKDDVASLLRTLKEYLHD